MNVADSTDVIISDNVFKNTFASGLQFVGTGSPAGDALISENQFINNNRDEDDDDGGFRFYGLTLPVTASDNSITEGHHGVVLRRDDSTKVTLECNTITPDSGNVAINNGEGTLDATVNWWGSLEGPDSTKIIGDVIYEPWSANAACSFFLSADTDVLAAVDDSYVTVVDGFLSVATPGVLENDVLGGTADFTARLVTDVPVGEGTLDWPAAEDGSFTYTPPAGWVGTTTFEYRACDAEDVCAIEPATVTIKTLVDANDDNYSLSIDEKLIISTSSGVLINDIGPNGETLTANILTYVDEGVLSFMSNGGFYYEPPVGWSGTTSFTYEACGNDSEYCSLPATVTISVGSRFELFYYLPLIVN